MIHELKIDENFTDAIISGDKNFEIRYNDRGYQKGDIIKFKPTYTSDGVVNTANPIYNSLYEITYVLNGWGLKEGYVVLGIKPYIE